MEVCCKIANPTAVFHIHVYTNFMCCDKCWEFWGYNCYIKNWLKKKRFNNSLLNNFEAGILRFTVPLHTNVHSPSNPCKRMGTLLPQISFWRPCYVDEKAKGKRGQILLISPFTWSPSSCCYPHCTSSPTNGLLWPVPSLSATHHMTDVPLP